MAILPDFAALLNSALQQRGNPVSYDSGVRNAMVFTSALRRRLTSFQAGRRVVGDEQFNQIAETRVSGDFFKGARVALQPQVVMGINPNMVRFRQPKRFSKKDTREGSVFFHFTNSIGQNNDILTIEFNGNTGNIDQRGSQLSQEEKDAAERNGIPLSSPDLDNGAILKFMAWHNLYLLTQEPMLLPDNTENVFTITYISALFPQAVQFNGFYNQVLEFEEDAKKPNSRNYHFEFTVTSTSPPLHELLDLVLSVVQNAPVTPSPTATRLGSNQGGVTP